ncbi:MAG: PAS domain S-box protein, partial [Desulforhopalus sp.]
MEKETPKLLMNKCKIKKLSFYILIHILLVNVFFLACPAQGQEKKVTKHVLLLITGQKDVPGYTLSEEEMKKALEQSKDYRFEYYVEYMDRYRFNDISYQNDLLELYRTKYISRNIDLVIAHGYHALEFAHSKGEEIFPQTPVVFSTVLETQLQRLNIDNTYTGSLIEINYSKVLNTVLVNHPDTQHIIIISGQGKAGRLIESQARAAYASQAGQYDFTYLGHLGMKDMLSQLKNLPQNAVLLYFYLSLDKNGDSFKPWEVATMVSEAASVPTYGLFDTYMGKGIVGGAMLSFAALGRSAGAIGLRILNGENAVDIPRTASDTMQYMFDWRQIQYWEIDEKKLPGNSIILYKKPAFFIVYRWYIFAAFLVILFQGYVIVSLAASRKKYKMKEHQLQISEDRYRAFIRNSYEGIWCVGFDKPIDISLPEEEQFELVYKYGHLTEANDAYARSVGYENGKDLIGTRIESFAPRSNPQNVATVQSWIRRRYTINNAETVETFADGVEKNILNNSIGIIESGHVVRVWGTHMDITSLRQAEKSLSISKDFTSAILNSLEDHIVVLDTNGEILTVNSSWSQFALENDADMDAVGCGVNYLEICRRATGAEEPCVTGQVTATAVLQGLTALIEGVSTSFSCEYPCHAPTEERWFQMSAFPFKGARGTLVVIHRNITKRKKMEHNLLEAELKYRTVADFTHDWEYWETPDGSLAYVSPSCERVSGYSANEFVEHPELLQEIIYPEDKIIWESHEHEKNTTAYRCVFRITNKKGHTRWLAHVSQPVYNEAGVYDGVRVSNRDITDLRLVEQKERELRGTLELLERKESLGHLAGSIAHELNQPLTGILSDAQAGELLLAQKGLNEVSIREILEDIIADTKRASLIITNLRDLFSNKKSEFKQIDVNVVVRETVEILKHE